jgi:hypothetical protein
MNWTPKPQRYRQFPYLLVQQGEESHAPEGIAPADLARPVQSLTRIHRELADLTRAARGCDGRNGAPGGALINGGRRDG